ncbi:hypothetical protein SAMN05421819_1288 [Bryocella elongata]|uniref:Glycosyltransferase RgtA/B/C/D-like domain-containing protein n=1 Tax=Bryocella elongata TaxID=863522 RepID=A0A1H5VSG2_9BACT|nr:hypothetical protein [Bryocella elongata]SEF90083.1 hypothetical protein SAMN05421819_1288 [Bryocella elongata]
MAPIVSLQNTFSWGADETVVEKLRLNRINGICSVACSITFLLWMQHVTGGIHARAVLFFLLLPLAFFYLGDGALRWLRIPLRPARAFPVAFLFGSVLGILLLFFFHVFLPLRLLAADGLLFLVALCVAAFSPSRMVVSDEGNRSWLAVAATFLILAAATFWTQDLRPALTFQGNQVVIGPWIDALFHAEFIAEIHDDASFIKLGHPDLMGRPLPIYHYASYILPASVEAWSPGTTAFDTVMTFWIPFGFVLLGFAAFCLATEWSSDLAGIAAITAVLLIPSAPTYSVPIHYYAFHGILAISIGLAYGIAGLSTGLILLTRGLRENHSYLLLAGVAFLAADAFLKVHIALVGIPLGLIWIVCCKKGWSVLRRLLVGMVLAVTGYCALRVLHHLNVGPNLMPFRRNGSVAWVSSYIKMMPSGFWSHLILRPSFDLRIVHKPIVVSVLVFAILGIWLPIWMVILSSRLRRKQWQLFDVVPPLAGTIYLYYALCTSPSQLGAPDELWHRPFVCLYFIAAVWCAAGLTEWLQPHYQRDAAGPLAFILGLSTVLMAVPWVQGKSVQHSVFDYQAPINLRFDLGLLNCALFVRNHSAQIDIVQDNVPPVDPLHDSANALDLNPLLSALAERRAYIGRSPFYWILYLSKTPELNISEERANTLKEMRMANSDSALKDFRDKTSIRWYIAGPGEPLSWPADVVQHPVFTSEGYRLYDLQQVPSAH